MDAKPLTDDELAAIRARWEGEEDVEGCAADVPFLLTEVGRLRAAVALIDLDDHETVFVLGTDAVEALRRARGGAQP